MGPRQALLLLLLLLLLLTSPHLTSPHLTSPHLTSPHLTSPTPRITVQFQALPPPLSPPLQEEINFYRKEFIGGPTPVYLAKRITDKLGGANIWFKREELAHTGAHKINNAVGQALLAKRLGKRRIIAETGAGQHGVATACVCALMDLDCTVYMGAVDCERQKLNVFRMKMLGAKVRVRKRTRTTVFWQTSRPRHTRMHTRLWRGFQCWSFAFSFCRRKAHARGLPVVSCVRGAGPAEPRKLAEGLAHGGRSDSNPDPPPFGRSDLLRWSGPRLAQNTHTPCRLGLRWWRGLAPK